jgi:hypothetical protein
MRFALHAAAAAALAFTLPAAHAVSAATCAGLKSGPYVVMNAMDADTSWRVNLLDVNAETLEVTDREGTVQLTATAENCRFELPNGGPLVVSKKGLFLARGNDGTPFMAVGMPVQTAALKKLVGTWNFMRQETEAGVSSTYNGVATINSKGALAVAFCDAGGASCGTPTTVGKLAVDAAGGYTLTSKDGKTERFFLNTLTDGSKVAVGVGLSQNALTVLAPQTARTLPAAGDKWAQWEVQQLGDTSIPDMSSSSFKVLSVDAATNSFTRKRLENCRVETWTVNSGRVGLAQRPGGSYTDCSDGLKKKFSANLSMSLRESFGFGAFGWQPATGNGFFGLTVVKSK